MPGTWDFSQGKWIWLKREVMYTEGHRARATQALQSSDNGIISHGFWTWSYIVLCLDYWVWVFL